MNCKAEPRNKQQVKSESHTKIAEKKLTKINEKLRDLK